MIEIKAINQDEREQILSSGNNLQEVHEKESQVWTLNIWCIL